MLSTIDIAWAAGFLEGEGCIEHLCILTATQVQKEPLERLQRIFGGKIKIGVYKNRPIHRWWLSHRRTVQVAMTIYILMSPKRQKEITRALDHWKNTRTARERGSNICLNNHEISVYNAMQIGKHSICRQCYNLRRKNKRRKNVL